MGKKVKGSIIDSSVILSTILEEENAHWVKKELRKRQKNLCSISLLDIEISNVLVYKMKNKEFIQEIFSAFRKLDITYLDTDNFSLDLARQIAFDAKSSVCDALYHATAIIYDYDFLTLDRKYFNSAKRYGNIICLD